TQSIQRRALIAERVDSGFAPQLSEAPFGVVIDNLEMGDTLGGASIIFTDSAGNLLPATALTQDGASSWFIPRRAILSDGVINVMRRDRSGTVDQTSLAANVTPLTQAGAVVPESGRALTRDARVPLNLGVDAAARVATQSIQIGGVEQTVASSRNANGYQWLRMPASGDTFTFDYLLNGNIESNVNYNLIDNLPEIDQVILRKPTNNQAFAEGQDMAVEFSVTENTAEEFRFAEVRVFDFNRNLIASELVGNRQGKLSLRLPVLEEQQNMFVQVRAYYGDAYRYAEQEVGVRIFPDVSVPKLRLTGIGANIMAGSELIIGVDEEFTSGASGTSITVVDDADNLIAAGADSVSLIVPDTTATLLVTAIATDEFGNDQQVTAQIRVIAPLQFNSASNLTFNAAITDVGDAWLAQDRNLARMDGVRVKTLDSRITALSYLGDRLLLALQNIGLVVLDPAEEFRIVGTHPLDGTVSHLAVANDRLLAVIDGKPVGFSVAGNAFERSADINIDGLVRDTRVRNNEFIALTNNGFAVIRNDFGVYRWIPGAFTAISEQDGHLFAADANARMHVFDADFREQVFDLDVPADRLLALQGDMLALSAAQQVVQVIDVRNPVQPALVGRFGAALGNDIGNAIIANGRLLIGGTRGASFSLNRSGGEPALQFATPRPRGFIDDVEIVNGRYLAAADFFGAIIQEQDRATVHPAPFTVSTTAVASHKNRLYLLQPDFGRVTALNTNASPVVALSGHPFSELASASHALVASVDGDLHFAAHDDFATGGVITVGTGDPIVALAASGETVYAANNTGSLYRVVSGALPVFDPAIRVESILSTMEPVRQLATDGDHIFYVAGTQLRRLRLHDRDDQFIELGVQADSIAYGAGRVWVAYDNQVQAVDIASWQLIPDQFIPVSVRVEGIDVAHDQLLLGLGGNGLQVHKLPGDWINTSAALANPPVNTVYQQTGTIQLTLADQDGVNAVSYFINDEKVATVTGAPFAAVIPVPADLRNGQPFDIRVESETVWGDGINSAPRRVILQGEGLPVNPFEVSLLVEDVFVPKPLKMTALVQNSTQPIQQVEFYQAENDDGPYEFLGKHLGPEYIILRNFPLDDAFIHLKARAVDIYGNIVESESLPVQRLEDIFAPLGTFSVEGQLINGRPASGHPFTVNVDINDTDSGIELALLRRNGIIVAAAFENGRLSYTQAPPAADEIFDFSILMQDRAGNERIIEQTYISTLDNPPTVTSVKGPDEIRERSPFSLRVRAADDLGVARITARWNGIPYTQEFGPGTRTATADLNISDQRAARLAGAVSDTLEITVTDNLGQVTSQTLDINVVQDLPPNAGNIAINAPLSGFFNSNIPVRITGLIDADDGSPEELRVAFIDVSDDPAFEAATAKAGAFCSLDCANGSVRAPRDDRRGETLKVMVRLTDRLGQRSDSIPVNVILTQRPNEIRFFKEDGDTVLNRTAASVGAPLPLQTRVIDSAGRPVPAQIVEWRLRAPGERNFVRIDDGTISTDENGLASFDLDTSRLAGVYQIRARLPNFRYVTPAVHNVQILPGPFAQVRVANVPPAEPVSEMLLRFEAFDAAGNPITNSIDERIVARIDVPGFYFGFADNVEIEPLVNADGPAGEQATISLSRGRADVFVTTTRFKGDYVANISYTDNAVITTRYDNDGDPVTDPVVTTAIPLTVLPGPPVDFRFAEVSRTNHPLGDPERLEVDETVVMQLRLVDEFGNLADTIKDAQGARQDANLNVTLDASGAATIDGASDPAVVLMTQGIMEFAVSDTEIEETTLSIDALDPQPAGVDTDATFTLNFLKRLPAITSAAFEFVHDTVDAPVLFTYTEAVAAQAAGEPLAITLDDVDIAGVFDVDDTTVRFAANDGFILNRCYAYDTENSFLRGVAEDDAVLKQTGTVCSPQAAIP
ncbi:MAG: hypothetical protein MJA83_18120, partial [Gammaproteobacteria bacterium]|nr:hypothetical protein [Gammaproteobacteria bacterium]